MFAFRFALLGLMSAAVATNHLLQDEDVAALLKRQAPGTPSYNCHDNCGQAISLSKRPDPCNNDAFKQNYANCLQCSGPDNYNIWRMYGNTLSTAGSACGLSTSPLSGKQPDVGPAVQAGGASSGAASATSALTSGSAAASRASATATNSASGVATVSRNSTASPTTSNAAQQSTNAAPGLGSDSNGYLLVILAGGALVL